MTDAQKSLASARKQFVAVAAVAVAAFAGISKAALNGARAIDENAKAARRIGASVAGFRALEIAASDAGVSLSSLADDVQTMNRELARAEIGEGNAGEALARLGMAASDFAGLDADSRVALLADAVQRLGLDSGETTLLLRDLGIRNREMALLVMGGGEALRVARADVQSYGLALSDVDAANIEAANDQIGRLGIITNYLGDQLAQKFVPALGAMAQAITDSMREGGTLRKVLDGLVASLDAVAIAMAGIVVSFGVRYVMAIAAATKATGIFTAALRVARAAVILLGGPLGIVWGLIGAAGAAWLIFRDNTNEADGAMQDAKNASDALNAALGTFYTTAAPEAGKAAIDLANDYKKMAEEAFNAADAELAAAKAINDALLARETSGLTAGRGEDAGRGVAARLAEAQSQYDAALEILNEARNRQRSTVTAVTGSMSDDMTRASTAAQELGVSVDLAMTGMAPAADAAAAAIRDVNEAAAETEFDPMVTGLRRISDGMIDAIANGKNLLQSFAQMLRQMALEAIKADIGSLIGKAFGGVASAGGGAGILGLGASLFGGARAAGGPVSAGRPYLVNENTARSEIFVPSQSGAILNVPQAQRALGNSMSQSSSGQGSVNVEPRVEVIVLDDPRKIDEYRTSPSGERARLRADRRLQGA